MIILKFIDFFLIFVMTQKYWLFFLIEYHYREIDKLILF